MNILIYGTMIGPGGIAHHTREFTKRLATKHNVKFINFNVPTDWDGINTPNMYANRTELNDIHHQILHQQTLWSIGDYGKKLREFPLSGYDETFIPDVYLVMAEANHHYYYYPFESIDKPKIAYFPWETTKLRDDFLSRLQIFEQVWVPSQWQRDIIINQGYNPSKLHIVAEGVDPSVFFPIKKFEFRKFKFLHVGTWGYRKSTYEIIKSFIDIYGNNSDVELRLAINDKFLSASDEISNFNKFGLTKTDNIVFLETMTDKEYVDEIQNADVYISCARGEGWNLPLNQAMACGIPSIWSKVGGQLQFADGAEMGCDYLYELPGDYKHYVNGVEWSWPLAPGIPGNLYEPDFSKLNFYMKDVYENYDYYKNKALEFSLKVRAEFDWSVSVNLAETLIEDLINFSEITQDPILINTSWDGMEFQYNFSRELDKPATIVFRDIHTGFKIHSIFHNKILPLIDGNYYIGIDQTSYTNISAKLELYIDGNLIESNEIYRDNHIKFDLNGIPITSELFNEFNPIENTFITYDEIFIKNVYSKYDIDVDKNDVVLDIGANYGFFSLYSLYKKASKVISVEPTDVCYSNLKKLSNQFSSIIPMNYAVFDMNGMIEFELNEYQLAGSFVRGINYIPPILNTKSISVNSIHINELLDTVGRIDFLKVDCEGSEEIIFDVIDNNKLIKIPKIVIEAHTTEIKDKIKVKLETLGYIVIVEPMYLDGIYTLHCKLSLNLVNKTISENKNLNIKTLTSDKKIRAVHILIDVDSERESESIRSMSKLQDYGIEYIQYVTQRYENDAWKLQEPIDGWKRHSHTHYGTYLSFKDIVLRYFTSDIDALIILEADCILSDGISYEFFVDEIYNATEFSKKNNIFTFSFGNNYCNNVLQSPKLSVDTEYPNFYITDKIILNHCILFTNSVRELLMYEYIHSNWDVADIWHNSIFSKYKRDYNLGITNTPYTFQHEGMSMIDNIVKKNQ